MGLELDSKELLSLDLNCGFVPKSISELLNEISMIPSNNITMKLCKLNDYVYLLEQEMRKIDAFKRELPLCMLLLKNAIAELKEEVVLLKKKEVEAMEEFMPLKGNSDEAERAKRSADSTDKKIWMSSAQLWCTPIQYETNSDTLKIHQDSFFLQESRYQERNGPSDQSLSSKNKGGEFVPFKKRYDQGSVKAEEEEEEEEEDWAVNGLSLSMPVVAEMGSVDMSWKGKGSECGGVSDGSSSQPQQTKKQRRCWSEELHQRFLNALQELGGAQAATPKQIREIMQVDGLTNDEVKSHLQKYRLHIRKLQPSSSSGSPNYDRLRRGECSDLPRPGIAQSGSPEGPLHLGVSAKGASVNGGESMEEEEHEDVKSESQSWKAHLQNAN
ncbi:hypothetical protein ACH5RR_011404 [Cinchona calisaya]|uniref:HTH myb-type domain-containing protein n=1 Tax=Cinchona calisaya TaxID=153742 RepID=A0ABD3A6C2_9GENT